MSTSSTVPFLLTCDITLEIFDTSLNSKKYIIQQVVIDTGSTITIGNLNFFEKKQIPYFALDSELQLTNILQSNMPNIKYYTKCSIIFNNTNHIVNNVIIYLLDTTFSEYKLLIGLDILTGLKINMQQSPVITLNNIMFKQNLKDTIILRNVENMEFQEHDILARETKTINPKQQTIIKTINMTQQDNAIFIEVPDSLKDIINISQKYIPKRGFITVRNLTDKFILIRKKVLLAQNVKTFLINNIISISDLTEKEQNNKDTQYREWVKNRKNIVKQNNYATEIKQYYIKLPILNSEMDSLLNEYNAIFSRTSEDIGFN